jgi:processive 1,2-diacylglycerol beta-glucosyltransferase
MQVEAGILEMDKAYVRVHLNTKKGAGRIMARILVLYASGGIGHRRAAQALVQAFQQRGAEEVQIEDALDHGATIYRQLYTGFYHELSEKAPALWEYAYRLTDKTEKDDTHFVNELRIFLDRLAVTELDELVSAFKPDAIVCTHFLPMHVLGHYKQKGKLRVPLYGVVTDYTGNAKWVCPEIDHYYVAVPKTAQMLVERGAEESRITITGIPIDPAIVEPKDSPAMRQKHQIEQAPVITLIGSALNVERVRHMVMNMLTYGLSGTLFVVAGRNYELQDTLTDLQSTPTLDLRVLGFVDYLDDLITASDLIITKSGGLIVSEIMARHTPMVVIDPIPGQEHWNADYIVSVGAGVQVRVAEMVPETVQNLLNNPQRLRLLRDNARKAAQPRAAFTIADAVFEALATAPAASYR